MAIIKRKTEKKIGKQVRKLIKQHGPKVALDAATALVTTLVNKATDKPAKKKVKKDKPDKSDKSDKGKLDKSDKPGGDAKRASSKSVGSKKSKKAAPVS